MARRPSSNPLLRALFGVLGVVSLGVGIAGIVMPLIPTTGPVLLAAFFFSMSNERLYGWITGHKRFGPAIRDYQEGLGIPLRAKALAVVMIAVTFGTTLTFAVDGWAVRLLLIVTAAGVSTFILTRPTKRLDRVSA